MTSCKGRLINISLSHTCTYIHTHAHTQFTGPSANLDSTPQDSHIPSCTPKTSTPRKQGNISALLHKKDGHRGETRLRKRGQPQQQPKEAREMPSKHKEVQASRKKAAPLDVRVEKEPRQGSKGSTRQTNRAKHPTDANEHTSPEIVADPMLKKAETHSREQRPRREAVTDQVPQPTTRSNVPSKRPALENITNVARNEGKKSAPPKKTKSAKGVPQPEAHDSK